MASRYPKRVDPDAIFNQQVHEISEWDAETDRLAPFKD